MFKDLPPILNERYRLGKPLGQGGVGSVFLSVDEQRGTEVAIKVLHPILGEREDLRKRFVREGQAMMRFDHPNLCRVVEVGQEGTWIYMVMERMYGTTHQLAVKSGGVGAVRALQIGIDVLDGLTAVHQKGWVHRDIKPANLLIDLDGNIKISDFGILRNTASNLTRTGAVMGTVSYMPPEQRRDSREVDARADLYALGASLFAISSGKVPPDLSLVHLQPHLMDVVPNVLRAFIRRSTAFNADDRFPSAQQMARVASEILDVLGVEQGSMAQTIQG